MMVTNKSIKQYGPASFKIAGQVHRLIGPVLQQEGCTDPHCMQTYFHDPDYQAKHRASRGRPDTRDGNDLVLREDIFMELYIILTDECANTYLQSFMSVNDFIEKNNLNPEELSIVLHATDKPPVGHHPGR